MANDDLPIPVERIANLILLIRGQRVILDEDLARVYNVSTARLNQQVRRNIERFPEDFAFVLSDQEFAALMLQSATSNTGRGGRRKPPLVYSEHGVIMAANVLRTPVALRAREANGGHLYLDYTLYRKYQPRGKVRASSSDRFFARNRASLHDTIDLAADFVAKHSADPKGAVEAARERKAAATPVAELVSTSKAPTPLVLPTKQAA